jgi:hypothetical protein
MPQVLSAILGELAHTLPLDLAAIWLWKKCWRRTVRTLLNYQNG